RGGAPGNDTEPEEDYTTGMIRLSSPPPIHLTPLVREIPWADPATLLPALANQPGIAFLDSARRDADTGRYSYLGFEPEVPLPQDDLDALGEHLSRWSLEPDPELPPFQGGVIGVLSYDLGQALESVPAHRGASLGFPRLSAQCYDVVASFDHAARKAWIVSTGVPEAHPKLRQAWAYARLERLNAILAKARDARADAVLPPAVPVRLEEAEARERYVEGARRVVEYIHAGDLCQANLSLRFEAPRPEGFDAIAAYLRLRERQPAPFAACIDTGHGWVLSASMERFVSLRDGEVETRPIKGTRPRGRTPEEDAALRDELAASAKDRAENLMIVDLLRNDLSRVCLPHSVRVPSLCAVESHAAVHHLVSTVRGELAPGLGATELLGATFPGGSITGAPKIRAMEIIAELESAPRGPYCGAVGWFGYDGAIDTSILIRTVLAGDTRISLSAGAGIVADSVPELEYEECVAKVRGIVEALAG
ncbi:MAG: aminodeoxychorismate synthase component I, partial [Longimicrobiales bacterium]|nr:aminodeoxychorismate synthase component I [Longimicrobiales bacterium]